MPTNPNHLYALEAAIASADAALDTLTEAEQAHGKALKVLCALSGAKDYGEARAVYERAKFGEPIKTGNGDEH